MVRITLSAALRCGLIEATLVGSASARTATCYPQHYAAASLKHRPRRRRSVVRGGYPQHYAAASLKLSKRPSVAPVALALSAALRCGLIEALSFLRCNPWLSLVIRSTTLRPH